MNQILQPEGWARPRGFSNGIAGTGRQIFVAGQIGTDENGKLVSADFAAQTAQALRNVVDVLASAGATGADLVRLTWYVTDKAEYVAESARIGELYREIVGAHYPAMTLVQVTALLEDGAKVELEATALVAEG